MSLVFRRERGVLLLLPPTPGSRGHPPRPKGKPVDLLHLRALLNEQHPHDGKPVIVATADGTRHTVTGLQVDDVTVTLALSPVEEETTL